MAHSANRAAVSIAQRNSAFLAREAAASSFRFHHIEALENFRDKDRARSILNQLANDRGILAVMEKHRYVVNVLSFDRW
jgi:pantothenate kinase